MIRRCAISIAGPKAMFATGSIDQDQKTPAIASIDRSIGIAAGHLAHAGVGQLLKKAGLRAGRKGSVPLKQDRFFKREGDRIKTSFDFKPRGNKIETISQGIFDDKAILEKF
jgi:hypothetical protein